LARSSSPAHTLLKKRNNRSHTNTQHQNANTTTNKQTNKPNRYQNDKIMPPKLRPSYYGYVMLQRALGAGSAMIGRWDETGPETVKVWPLRDAASGSLRVLVLNKAAFAAANVDVRVNRAAGYGAGSLLRLVARGANPLAAADGITLGGQYYQHGGALAGVEVKEAVPAALVRVPRKSGGGGVDTLLRYRVYMPPGSAALLTIPKTA
jgi:hypothetical protein